MSGYFYHYSRISQTVPISSAKWWIATHTKEKNCRTFWHYCMEVVAFVQCFEQENFEEFCQEILLNNFPYCIMKIRMFYFVQELHKRFWNIYLSAVMKLSRIINHKPNVTKLKHCQLKRFDCFGKKVLKTSGACVILKQ